MASYSPYQLADPSINLMESLLESRGKVKKGQTATTAHKGKLGKEFEAEVAAAEEKARQELKNLEEQQRQRIAAQGRSKRTGFFRKVIPSLISYFLPGVGGAISGVMGAREQEKMLDLRKQLAQQSKDYATRAKSYAKDIDPRWNKLFTSKGSRAYLKGAEDVYGGIEQKASRDLFKATQDYEDREKNMFATALKSGLTSYATGKAMQKGFEKLGGGTVKDVKGLEKADISKADISKVTENLDKLDFEGALGTESIATIPTLQRKFPDISEANLTIIEKLHNKGIDIESMMGKKMPMLKEIMKGLGKTGRSFSMGEEGDILKSLLAMFSQGQSRKDLEGYEYNDGGYY